MKILLACQTATNKGDRAIAEYIITQLVDQGHEVILSTTRPDLWKDLSEKQIPVIGMGYKCIFHNVKNVFMRKALSVFSRLTCDKMLYSSLISPKGKHRLCQYISRDFISVVKEVDLVIVTGGHHITSIREKNALFQFTYDIGLISLYAKRYFLWSQTIGPLSFSSDKAKAFIGNIIRKAEKVFIRDENSVRCVEQIYGKSDNLVRTYDSVFGFGHMDFPDVSDREKKVGISIFDGLKKAFKTYETIAQMLDWYAKNGYAIEFFRMEYNDFELDNIHKVISLMKQKAEINIHPFLTTTQEHLKNVAFCKCFIGYKTHSVIMALTTATPLIAIAYHEKTVDFMNDFGLSEYVVLDDELDSEIAEKCMFSMSNNIEHIQQKQRNVARRMADKLLNDLCEMVNNVP